MICEVSVTHIDVAADSSLPEYYAVSTGEYFQVYELMVVPSSLGSRSSGP